MFDLDPGRQFANPVRVARMTTPKPTATETPSTDAQTAALVAVVLLFVSAVCRR